jgi:hypothetical protein
MSFVDGDAADNGVVFAGVTFVDISSMPNDPLLEVKYHLLINLFTECGGLLETKMK